MARLTSAAIVVTCLSGVLLLAGCGSPQSKTSPTPVGSAAPTTSAPTRSASPVTPVPSQGTPSSGGVQRCTVADLSVSVGRGNAAAGTVGRPFIFTNHSPSACALYGYPGMLMLAANGTVLPTNVVRAPGPMQPVTLVPGGAASFLARWHDQTGYTTPCPSSSSVEITPPNAYNHLVLKVSMQACPNGTINVTPVRPGTTGGQ